MPYNIPENIRKALDGGYIVYGVLKDLQKSFYTEDHQILLAKLNHCRICGGSKNRFKYYLPNHSQYASINGDDSGLAALNCVIT